MAVGLRGLYKAHDVGGALTGGLRSGEQPVLAAERGIDAVAIGKGTSADRGCASWKVVVVMVNQESA